MSLTSLDTIRNYARKNGFVYQSSEIYGGFAATYDFGQNGLLLKKNLEQAWRYWNVTSRTDMEEIEGAIFMHPKVWEASGHASGFSDLMVDDLKTKKRYRADHLIEDAGIMDNAGALSASETDEIIKKHNLKSPDGNDLGPAKKFNLLVKTHLGPVEDDTTMVYLKGESCQNIYLNWKIVQETSRRKLPFGIAQIGKAFRNEITVKQYMFRTREFEQMDVQYFVKPGTEDEYYQSWKQNRIDFYTKFLKFSPDNIQMRQHNKDELVFYAKDAWDVEYRFGQLGFKEMEGVHNRTSYDTDQHNKFSGTDLTYFDTENSTRYNPYIVEMSAGFNRIFLAVLFEFYNEETITGEDGKEDSRIVMKFPFKLAPYKIAVLPLMKKDGLKQIAEKIQIDLRKDGILADYDESGSIGKRYRRQDEVGTPWCLVVDYQTKEDDTVTLRHRDSMDQVRVKIDDIKNWLNEEKFGF
jgi:glycyl-tRNA synthetase